MARLPSEETRQKGSVKGEACYGVYDSREDHGQRVVQTSKITKKVQETVSLSIEDLRVLAHVEIEARVFVER